MTDKRLTSKEEEEALFLSKALWLLVTVVVMFLGIYILSH